jgi:hypothetical protein|nr:MAG TPA: hypothetical protein [Caudoviricetes sp.]
MLKFFRKLKWLIKNQEKIEKLLQTTEKKKDTKNYSILGVPDYQLDYINDILETDKK